MTRAIIFEPWFGTTRILWKDVDMGLPVIDSDSCTVCGICVDECATAALDLEDVAVLARPDDCTECGTCEDVCPSEAISLD